MSTTRQSSDAARPQDAAGRTHAISLHPPPRHHRRALLEVEVVKVVVWQTFFYLFLETLQISTEMALESPSSFHRFLENLEVQVSQVVVVVAIDFSQRMYLHFLLLFSDVIQVGLLVEETSMVWLQQLLSQLSFQLSLETIQVSIVVEEVVVILRYPMSYFSFLFRYLL